MFGGRKRNSGMNKVGQEKPKEEIIRQRSTDRGNKVNKSKIYRNQVQRERNLQMHQTDKSIAGGATFLQSLVAFALFHISI